MSAIDWDAIEQKAMKMPAWTTKQHQKKARVLRPGLPALPLHLSSIHLKEFVAVRCNDLGILPPDLFKLRDRVSIEIKRQIMFEAFMLGFPTDYIIKHFNCDYCQLSYAIKDYCGNFGVQTIRERYGLSVYSRSVFRV